MPRNRYQIWPQIRLRHRSILGKRPTRKDRTNCHIVLLAKNENGREWINEVLSTANEDGYYYRPRLDEELLFSLPPDDVFVTSACVAFWHYEPEYVEQLICKLHDYFKDNFMLEIQAHNTDKQKQLNARILKLSKSTVFR